MEKIPKVLLLGDSIRMSYQPHVARLLEGKATVVGPSDNCQFTLYTLARLGYWIEDLGRPDIIHWNNGLHDVGHNPDRFPVQIPIDMYRANLEFILKQLKAITPHVIWASTTPAHPQRPLKNTEWSWRNEEIDTYNAVALKLMQADKVPINDLHALVWNNVEQFLAEDQLHLSGEGQQACARAVVECVSQFLSAG